MTTWWNDTVASAEEDICSHEDRFVPNVVKIGICNLVKPKL